MDNTLKYRFGATQSSEDNQACDESTAKIPTPIGATITMKSSGLSQEEIHESMTNLKEKLDFLKSMVDGDENHVMHSKKTSTFVDEKILSMIFACSLIAILAITVYAFQGLYVAVVKRWTT